LAVRCDRPAAEVEARHRTPEDHFVVVGGLRVHYRDRGNGPVIVLLHGSNSSLYAWEGWVPVLAKDHRVITLDLPGHGLTGPDPLHRYSAQQMADFLYDFARTLEIERFVVGGHSMGGNVAWHYALSHPQRVQQLILVDSAGLPRREPRPLAFRLFASKWMGWLGRWVSPQFLIAGSLRQTYFDPRRVTGQQIALYEDLLLREGNRGATRERFVSSGDDGAETHLPMLHVPTLIVWGAEDRWILPKYADEFGRLIPGSKLVVLPKLSHDPMEEDPAVSVAPVLAFLTH
jgi:pimeloyl-ACP methyl ester carboxylesterase